MKLLKPFKTILCSSLTALLLFAGCSDGDSSQTETTVSTTVPVTQPVTEVSTEDLLTNVSTADSVVDESKIKYDYFAIKQNMSEIETTLDTLIDKNHFQGVFYSKLSNDFEYLNAIGAADEGAHVNNSINSRFYTGSVTKQITAAAVMKLAEEKALDLNQTIDNYFPNCAYAKNVTVKHLLTMTSGIPNYVERGALKTLTPALEAAISSDNSYKENKSAVLSWILSQDLRFDAGSEFAYSDSNYFLLGEIIAQAGGQSYEDYIQKRFLTPLGMNKSGFEKSDALARAYGGNRHSVLLMCDGVGYSSFGFISNISDLLRWTDGLLSYQVISEASFREMITDNGNGFGYGVWVDGDRISSIGSIDAFCSKLFFTTDKSQMFVAFTNYADSDPNFIHRLYRNYLVKFRN